MGFFAIARLLSNLLPALIMAMKAVETVMPQKGSGPEKLNTVITVLRGANEVADATKDGVDFEKLVPVIGGIAGHLVTHFNKTDSWDKPIDVVATEVKTPETTMQIEAP